MTIKFEKIKEGMTLYDVRKNTGMTRWKWNIWRVHIKRVDLESRRVFASWNNNLPEWMHESRVTKYRAKKPKD